MNMKALVDHGGIVQFKYILRNEDDVIAYHRITAHQHGRAMLDFSEEPNRVRDVMSELAKMRGDSMLMTATKMVNDKLTAMMKQINKGKVVVVNMAGGWCFWSDDEMREFTFDDFMETVINVSHTYNKRDLDYALTYVYPDIPNNTKKGDIIKLYKTQSDRSDNKDVIFLESIEDGWKHICTECINDIDAALSHAKQVDRKAQMFKLVGTKIPQPVN
jgi:hypothetical protein